MWTVKILLFLPSYEISNVPAEMREIRMSSDCPTSAHMEGMGGGKAPAVKAAGSSGCFFFVTTRSHLSSKQSRDFPQLYKCRYQNTGSSSLAFFADS